MYFLNFPQPSRMDNKHGEPHKTAVKSSADPSTVDAAAARIQAGYRGYHFRRTHPELTHPVHIAHHHHQAQHHQHTPSGNPRANEPHELTPSTAATRIQAGFRGYQTRKQIHLHGEPHSEYSSSHGQVESHALPPELAAAKIQAGFRGYRTRRELKQQRKYLETARQINQNNVNEIRADPNYAATKIQATFRGYQTRRALHENDSNRPDTKLPLRTHDSNSHSNVQSHARPYQTGYRDPDEVNKAATVIQAGFRGYQTRKHLHSPHSPNSPVHASYHSGGLLNKENADQAATKMCIRDR